MRSRGRRMRFERGPGAQVVLDLPAPPHLAIDRRELRRLDPINSVEESNSTQFGERFLQTVKVALHGRRLIPDDVHERPLQRLDPRFVAQPPGKGLQDAEIGRSFDIEHPAGLLRLIVLVERDVPERLQHLTAAVVDAVRMADKGHDHVAARGLVEQHLGVTGGDDLTAALARHFGEQTVDLALAENLQVRVRLVQQQNGARIRVHVRQQQQRLLQAAAGGRQVEPDAPLAIGHHDLAASGDVPRGIELSAEQTPDMHQQPVPWRRSPGRAPPGRGCAAPRRSGLPRCGR